MQTKTDLTPYIVSVSGKDFITFPGLLQEAHALGLISISTELLTSTTDLSSPVVKATVTLLNEAGITKVFSGYGDACEKNVAPKVRLALLRMSETRAIARALRFACNISMAALEELDSEESVISHNTAPVTQRKTFLQKTETTTPKTETTSALAPTLQTTNVLELKEEKTTEVQKLKPSFSSRFGNKTTTVTKKVANEDAPY